MSIFSLKILISMYMKDVVLEGLRFFTVAGTMFLYLLCEQ